MVWREQFPLERTKPMKKTIAGGIWALFIFVIFGIFFAVPLMTVLTQLSVSSVLTLVLALFIVVVVLIYVYQIFYINSYFYDLANKTLVIRKGVFSISEITLPIKRLQDVYVDQDILDRIFGLYDVHVSSATMVSGWLSHIDGVNKENSEKIKNLLLEQIHK